MTTLRQAAQQALAAIKSANQVNYSWACVEAVAVLEAALAEEALQRLTDVQQDIEAALAEPDYWQEEARRYAGNADYWRKRFKTLAEPEQEPVPSAWRYKDTARICDNSDKRMTAPPGWVPLYSAPPQRKPEQEPVAWMEMVVANLVREGVNKHKARQLAQHFAAPPQRKPLTDEHPLMVFAKECVLGAYSEKELADAANRAIKYAHSFKGEA